jgi:hypothetical protein
MSILEIAAVLSAKAVAGVAAATLAVGGAAGLSIANNAVAETPADVEVPAGDGAETRAENADHRAENADHRAENADHRAENADAADRADLEFIVEDLVPAVDDAEGEGRAADVHAALTDGADVEPGSREFGEAVSHNARTNPDFGRNVADAASQGASTEGRARADEARSQREAGSAEAETEETGDRGQRPADTPAEQSAEGQERANTAPQSEHADDRANDRKPSDRP